jgi:plasmid stabilization system protein ParE
LHYSVEITDVALADAEEYVLFIRQQSNDEEAAVNWWNGLLDAIDSLESLPARCPRIPEARHFGGKLHHLLYASHRIIFEIEPERVTVLRIYHAARSGLKPRKLTKKRASPGRA